MYYIVRLEGYICVRMIARELLLSRYAEKEKKQDVVAHDLSQPLGGNKKTLYGFEWTMTNFS